MLEMFVVDLEDESNSIECRKATIGLADREEILRLNLTGQKMREFKAACQKCFKSNTEN